MLVILNAAAVLLYAVSALALALLLVAAASRRLWMLGLMLASMEVLTLLGGGAHFLDKLGPVAALQTLQLCVRDAAVWTGISVMFSTLVWSGLSYPLAAVAVLAGVAGAFVQPWATFAVCGWVSVVACGVAARVKKGTAEKWFFVALSVSLVLPSLAAFAPGEPRIAALSYFVTIALLYIAVQRQNLFGLLISRRSTLVVALGIVTAIYLLLIKMLADTLGNAFETIPPSVIEVSLVLVAVVLWMPLLSWTNRVIGKRAALYTEFGQRVINGAVSTLTVGDRAEFLANGIRRLLNVQSVRISILGPRPIERSAGDAAPLPDDALAKAIDKLQDGTQRFLHRLKIRDAGWEQVFAAIPYNYIVPLRYENRLTGILWVDSAPRLYLDDFEPVLLDIARQTSHSLESCRLVEEKIQLERSLMTQRQLAALGNVAASIAHEVKNPLSSIRALVQLMSENEAFRQTHGQDLEYILAEIDRLNGSVRQLLTFARPPAISAGDIDLTTLVAGIVGSVRKEKAGQPLEVNERVSPGLVLHHASGEALEQIVWNLVLNALQATDGRGHVEVVAEPAGAREIRLAVSDDGPGIPPEIRERIFEPYFTTRQRGSGLGLSIVEKNVLALRGSMAVESPLASGHGTRFTVLLPEDRPGASP